MHAESVIAAVVGWLLTQVVAQRIPERYRSRLPAIAVVLSSLIVVGYDAAAVAVAGQPMTWETIGAALSAGGLAILGHAGQSIARGAVEREE